MRRENNGRKGKRRIKEETGEKWGEMKGRKRRRRITKRRSGKDE